MPFPGEVKQFQRKGTGEEMAFFVDSMMEIQ
jgi:hypothetical protein